MTPNELDFILINLCTRKTPAHIYRTNTPDDIEVLYYTLDIQLLMEKKIFAPIYYHKNDVQRLSLPEPLLFQKVMMNTAIILPGRIIEFASYLKEKEEMPCGVGKKLLLHSITDKLYLLPAEEKLWCLTNTQRYGGALGFYQLTVLKEFCNRWNFSEILIGVGNRDYAYILKETPKNQGTMRHLLEQIPDIMEDNEPLTETYLFTYNNETNKLTRIS